MAQLGAPGAGAAPQAGHGAAQASAGCGCCPVTRRLAPGHRLKGRDADRVARWEQERARLHNELPAWLAWGYRQWWIYAVGTVFLLGQVAAYALDGADAADVALGLAAAAFRAGLAWFGYRHRQQ